MSFQGDAKLVREGTIFALITFHSTWCNTANTPCASMICIVELGDEDSSAIPTAILRFHFTVNFALLLCILKIVYYKSGKWVIYTRPKITHFVNLYRNILFHKSRPTRSKNRGEGQWEDARNTQNTRGRWKYRVKKAGWRNRNKSKPSFLREGEIEKLFDKNETFSFLNGILRNLSSYWIFSFFLTWKKSPPLRGSALEES